jgi:hypothetical protein
VDDPGPVRGRQAVGALAEHVQRPVDGERALVVQDRDERLTLDELHDEEGQLLAGVVDGLAVVEDGGDVGVGQGRGVAGLVPEAREEARVPGELALEHLRRDDAVEHLVAGLPDLAHAAHGDRRGDLVAPGQHAPDRQCHQPPCPSR